MSQFVARPNPSLGLDVCIAVYIQYGFGFIYFGICFHLALKRVIQCNYTQNYRSCVMVEGVIHIACACIPFHDCDDWSGTVRVEPAGK